MSSTSKTFIQLFLKRDIREFLRKFLNCDTWQLFFCSEGHIFEIKTEAYTKLRFSSATCSSFHEDLFFQLCSFTKTCSFGTYLERGSIFCAWLQFHEDSFFHEDNHYALWFQVLRHYKDFSQEVIWRSSVHYQLVLRLVLPSTKTCSFIFVLSRRLVLSELILRHGPSLLGGTRSHVAVTIFQID